MAKGEMFIFALKVTQAERRAYEMAAEAAGLSRHGWSRIILNAAAEISALPDQLAAARARAEELKK